MGDDLFKSAAYANPMTGPLEGARDIAHANRDRGTPPPPPQPRYTKNIPNFLTTNTPWGYTDSYKESLGTYFGIEPDKVPDTMTNLFRKPNPAFQEGVTPEIVDPWEQFFAPYRFNNRT